MTKVYLTFIITVILSYPAVAQTVNSSILVHTDFPFINDDNQLAQELFYSADSTFKGTCQLQCFRFNKPDDSLLLYKKTISILFKQGTSHTLIRYNDHDNNTWYLPAFYDVLKKIGTMPPGSYKVYITIGSGSAAATTMLLQQVDSDLAVNSSIRREVNNTLLPRHRSFLGIDLGSKLNNSPAGTAISNAKRKLNRSFAARGLTPVTVQLNGKTYINFYYEDWFVGRYEAKRNLSLARQVTAQQNELAANEGSFTNNDLEDHQTLFSQFRTLKKEKKDKEEIKGELSLSQNISNGQEPYSDLDNNYTELRGSIEVPVAGMPVDIEGMYTTQDARRLAKASYIHFHYDTDKAKEELSKLIHSYNEKYEQTVSKGKGLEMVYQSYITNLQGQRSVAQAALQQQLGSTNISTGKINIDSFKQAAEQTAVKEAKDKQQQTAKSDSDTTGNLQNATAHEQKVKDSVDKAYRHIQAQYERLQAIERNIIKYQTLLTQYQHTNYFDSALAYSKMKDIQNTDQLTYKQMAKRADNLLPEGKVKSFATGITQFDAGMFSAYQSKFTMDGQQLKGLSFGYDLGICQAGVTIGKTQYIGRDGTVDNYTTYSAKAMFQPYHDQQIGLIYYGYMPSKQMLADDFFKNMDLATPSFKDPVHIISLDYKGQVSRYVMIDAEAATSINHAPTDTGTLLTSNNRSAYSVDIEGNIPNTYITVDGSYSKAGAGFQNDALPISPAGTEQYKLAATGDFFKSFLTLGLEYDYMLQSNFASSGGNRRWGFNIQIHSRRYPSFALSYKPFTTFRSYTDTLNIPQRPLIGSVWISRASYQLRLHDGKSWRFMAMYNKSSSTMDTSQYGTNTLQLTCMYTTKQLMLTVSGGNMQMTGNNTTAVLITTPNQMHFASVNANYNLSKQIGISGGQDVGVADFGFCRYGANAGVVYQFNNIPLVARLNLRYNDYELDETEGWKQLYSGNIDLTWRFKCKMKTKE